MEKQDLVTIVTVVYNAEKELEETIQSVLNQTYPNIEFVVVDGASKDGTMRIIKKYQDSITSWISEPDKGVYDAMNKGIDLAKGDWVIFMNAGDFFYSSDVIASVFSGKDKEDYTNFAVVYGDTEYRLKTQSYVAKAMQSQGDRFMPFSHQAAFTRVDLAKKYKFDTKYKIASDIDFYLRLTKDGYEFKRVDQVICSYDARQGLSMRKDIEVLRVKEFADMQIRYGVPADSPYLKKLLRKAYIKQYVRYLIPDCIWMRLRERQIIKGIKK